MASSQNFIWVRREFYFSHVESSDSGDVVSWMHDSGGLSLGFRQDDIYHVLGRGNGLDVLEVVVHSCC